MLGLHQRYVHDNLNLFMKGGYDQSTGASIVDDSDATTGDYIEFYAEMELLVALSLCPAGSGSDDLRDSWNDAAAVIHVNPVLVTILDTGTPPLGWPLPESVASGAGLL